MSENKSFLESISENRRPESFEKETFVPVRNNKIMGILATVLSVGVVVIVSFLFYAHSQKVEMKDLVGSNITDTSLWAQKNGLIIVVKSVYSFDKDEGIILEQDVAPGETIKKKDSFTLQVSAGADPEEAIAFPDIKSMNADDVDAWVDQNKLTGIQINTASSTIVAQDQVIEYSFTDGDEESFQRKSRVAITLSSGPADEGDTVIVADFSTMNEGKVLQWGAENDVPIVIEEDFNKYFKEGEIISQSVKSGEEILKNEPITVSVSLGEPEFVPDFSSLNAGKVLQWGSDNGVLINILEEFNKYFEGGAVISQSVKTGAEIASTPSITVHISLGKPVTVPDFSTQTKEEASAWAKLSNVTVTTIESYNSMLLKGKLISQSLTKGSEMKTGDEIKLYYSLGKVDVASYIGKTKLDMLAWQSEVNSKGANITLRFKENNGSKGTAGKIIEQSIQNNQVGIDAIIDVTVSKGALVMVPDFKGLSETECISLADSLGLNAQYQYITSTTIDQGYFIKQEPSKGALIDDSAKITLTISLSEVTLTTVVVPDFTSMKASEILKWGTDHDVKMQLYETYSNFVSTGSIVSQSVKEDAVINKGSTILIGVSIGKAPQTNSSMVPDFSVLSEAEASAWAKSAGVNLAVVTKYSDTYPKGMYYTQSITKENSIEEGGDLRVTQSLGKVSVTSFVGKTKLDALSWQQEVNSKGANITINFTNTDESVGSSGKVTSQTIMNDYVSLNAIITMDIHWE